MPLAEDLRITVLEYCRADIREWNDQADRFGWIPDKRVAERLGREMYKARYVYKLMEALWVDGIEREAHVKFQIVQYMGIYEAVMLYLMLAAQKTRRHRRKIDGVEKRFGELEDVPNPVRIDVLKSLGVFDTDISKQLREINHIRNSIHLISASERDTVYDMTLSKVCFEMLTPIMDNAQTFLAELAELPKANQPARKAPAKKKAAAKTASKTAPKPPTKKAGGQAKQQKPDPAKQPKSKPAASQKDSRKDTKKSQPQTKSQNNKPQKTADAPPADQAAPKAKKQRRRRKPKPDTPCAAATPEPRRRGLRGRAATAGKPKQS